MTERPEELRRQHRERLAESRRAWPRSQPPAPDEPPAPDGPVPVTLDEDLAAHYAAGRMDLNTAATLQTLRTLQEILEALRTPSYDQQPDQ